MSNTNKKYNTLDSPISTGNHLEELRRRLIYAVVGLVVCTAISLGFGPRIISFVEKPYTNVMGPDAPLQTLAPSDGIIAYLGISLIVGELILASPGTF